MAPPPLLVVEGISKRYGRVQAVHRVSFHVPPGVAFGLAGPNGAGKTTLLQCIVGIRPPTEGRVWVAGRELTQDDIAPRRDLAFVPELPETAGSLTPLDHLAFVGRVLSVPGWEAEARRLIVAFGISHKSHNLCRTLSKGEQQKVGLMTALLRRPRVLLIDEPLLGLDPQSVLALKRELASLLAAGGSAVLSSHVLALIEEVCPVMGVLSRGRLVFVGSPEGLRALAGQPPGSSLEEAFVRVVAPGGAEVVG